MSIQSRIFVSMCKKADTRRDAGLTSPADIERFDDIPYVEKFNRKLDVYRPKESRLPLPVIVSVHGGGWVYGDKEVYQYYCMDLAKRGFAVVNFTYRLAPKHKFPAAVEDTNLAFAWVMEHAKEYGLDTENLFAVGDSAGAQILAMFASMATNPDYAKEYAFRVPEGLKLKGLGLNCGLYAVEDEENISFFRDLLKGKGTREERRILSPATFVTPAYPPCFILTANGDELKKQAPFMVEALRKNDVPCTFREYGSDENMLYHVFHCNVRSEDARQANDEECGFFSKLMK